MRRASPWRCPTCSPRQDILWTRSRPKPPSSIRQIDGKPTIAKIDLVTVGHVPGIDEATFKEHAAAAKAGCIVSRALAGVPEITLEASLAG